MTLEAEDRAINIGLSEQDAGVVYKIARGKIVGAIHDDVVVFQNVERVFAGEMSFKEIDLNFGVQIVQATGGGFDFRAANVAGAEQDLALEIGEIHAIEIDEADASNARGGEIQAEWRSKTAGANAQNFGLLELQLPVHADFRHDQVTAIAQDFFLGKRNRCVGGRGLR